MLDKPKLRFSAEQIRHWASRYNYPRAETELVALTPTVQERGYLTMVELQAVSLWKAPRIARHVSENEDSFVRDVTATALRASDERLRIEVLTLLDGVQWPMASVILHLFHTEPYPMLDYRALWSVGLVKPTLYRFSLWWVYVTFCRQLAKLHSVEMRLLDQALWQYSKENQPPNLT